MVLFLNVTLSIGFNAAGYTALASLVRPEGLVQAIAPNQVLGRVTTFIEILAVLSVPLSAVLGGWIIDRVGSVALAFGILGGFVALVALAFLGSPWPTSSATCHRPEVAAETVSTP